MCVLCPTWCWYFCTVKTGSLFWALLRTSGVKVLLVTGKISWWPFSKGLIKTHLRKYFLFTVSRGKSLSQSLGSDVALSRMARRLSRLALWVGHQEMRSGCFTLYQHSATLPFKESFCLPLFIPLEYNKNWTKSQVNPRNRNPCSLRCFSTQEKEVLLNKSEE